MTVEMLKAIIAFLQNDEAEPLLVVLEKVAADNDLKLTDVAARTTSKQETERQIIEFLYTWSVVPGLSALEQEARTTKQMLLYFKGLKND